MLVKIHYQIVAKVTLDANTYFVVCLLLDT